jgi:DNA-binding transcriptional regulator YiaG
MSMSYQYKECGLDNIYLANGYRIHKTTYGEGVSIQDTEGLHKAIGRWLVSTPKPLTGAVLRFLRLEMDTTQRDLAGILGTTEQSLRLWEKYRKKAIPGSSDHLLRAVYLDYIGGDGRIRRMLERLMQLDQLINAEACFQKNNNSWKPQVPCLPAESAAEAETLQA